MFINGIQFGHLILRKWNLDSLGSSKRQTNCSVGIFTYLYLCHPSRFTNFIWLIHLFYCGCESIISANANFHPHEFCSYFIVLEGLCFRFYGCSWVAQEKYLIYYCHDSADFFKVRSDEHLPCFYKIYDKFARFSGQISIIYHPPNLYLHYARFWWSNFYQHSNFIYSPLSLQIRPISF